MQPAEPDADVDALLDQIDIAVVERHPQLDVGIARLERAKKRHHLQPAERHRHVDVQIAGRPQLRVLEHELGLLDLGQRLTAALEEGGAVLGEADAPRGAGEQPGADLILEPGDGVADARLGDAEIGRGAHEAQALRHLHEDRQRA